MTKKTSDTQSDIKETPQKLYNPRYESTGDDITGNVVIGNHDISKTSKATLGDFLSRVTKGEAGSAKKPNAFAVDPDLVDMRLTDPSTGLPANQTNPQKGKGDSKKLKTAGTTLGSFIDTVDDDAKAKFDNLSTGDFNNAEGIASLANKDDKNSQKFGHTVYSDIEPVQPTGTNLGAPPTYAPAGSEVQKKISAVLTSNRFNPSPQTPFMQDNSALSLGYTKQTELGKYTQNQPTVKIDDISKVGHQMVVAGTGHDADLESMLVAGVLPTLEQITGLKMVDTQGLRPRSMPAASSVAEDKGELVKGESDNKSYGHLHSPIEPYAEALPVGSFINTVAGIVALSLATVVISQLIDLLKPSDSGTPRTPVNPDKPHTLQKGKHMTKGQKTGDMIWTMLGVPAVQFDFSECVYLGILSFYGIKELPSGGDLDLNSLLESAQTVAGSPGYYGAITRSVIRDVDQIVQATSNIPFGPDALLQIFNIVEALTSSATWKFLMQMAKLGNQIRSGIDGLKSLGNPQDVDGMLESPNTRISKSRAKPVPGGAKYPGSKLESRLAWRHSASPSRYILPDSFKNALISAKRGKSSSSLSELYFANGGKPAKEDIDGGGNLNSFNKSLTSGDTPGRLSNEYVEFIENALEAEYMPFYFHDLRTNEIISFHAFLGAYSDGFSTDYTSTSGYGRSDDVKIYNKTTRSISFDFTVAATSEADLDVMYWNINKIVSMCYPQWSRGRQMINGDDDKFIQPFSQIPTASPMIRVRLGDMLKSNYSKFGLQRLFGLGNSDTEFNIDKKTDTDAAAKKQQLEAQKKAQEEAIEIFNMKQMSVAGLVQAGSNLDDLGYAEGDLVLLNSNPTKYWPRTADGKMGSEQSPEVGPEAIEGRLHQYSQNVEVEVIKRVPAPNNEPTGFGAAAAALLGDDPPAWDGKGMMTYLVKIKEGSPAHMSLGNIKSEYLHHRAEHGEIVGLSEKGKQKIIDELAAKHMKGDPPYQEGEERFRNFFDPDKNFIVRSFESTRGRGLAGFITGLTFDWAESTWEITKGRRAPKMVKLSVSFAPVHDLHMGLDHHGMMTSVPFNVGKFSGIVGGDPYLDDQLLVSENHPSSEIAAKAEGKSLEKGSGKKNKAVEAAKKAKP